MSTPSGPSGAGGGLRRVLMASGRTALGLTLAIFLVKQDTWPSASTLPDALWVFAAFNLLTLVGAATESRRLMVLFSAANIQVSFWTAFRLVAIGTLFSYWIPGGTGGDVMKLYYLAGRNKGRTIEVATVLLVDRATAFVTLLVLILGLLAMQPEIIRTNSLVRGLAIAAMMIIIGVVAGILMLWSDRVRDSRVWMFVMKRIPLAKYLVRIADAIYGFRQNRSAIPIAAMWCLAGHLTLAVSLGLVSWVLVPALSPLVGSTLALLGIIANVVPLTPGGLGVGEAATEAIFRTAGASGGAIVVVAWRIGNLMISLLGALFYMYGMNARDRVRPIDDAARRGVEIIERV